MKGLYEEILEIPQRAADCYEKNKYVKLPENVPYLGMGSSYFAPLTLFYCGAKINPQIASEYYYYLSRNKENLGVLVSQSGESSETVWNKEKFEKYYTITNNKDSSLGKNAKEIFEIFSGEENYSSTKSYINTLITLYLGLGFDPKDAIEKMTLNFINFQNNSQINTQKILGYMNMNTLKGLYIIGSGPNIGTAYEGALTMSETTKLAWIGMPLAQYDHGPKETADKTIVIILDSNGKDKKRIQALSEALKNSDALIIRLEEKELEEIFSPLTLIVQLNLIMNYLADLLNVGETFLVGGKITTVQEEVK